MHVTPIRVLVPRGYINCGIVLEWFHSGMIQASIQVSPHPLGRAAFVQILPIRVLVCGQYDSPVIL